MENSNTRRNVLKVLGLSSLTLLIPKNAKGETQSDLIKITYRLGDERRTITFDLNQHHKNLLRSIDSNTWWPDRNSQGVYEKVEHNGVVYPCAETDFMLFPSTNDIHEVPWDFITKLPDGNFLTISRFTSFVYYYDDGTLNRSGGTVGIPIGVNGRLNCMSPKNKSGQEMLLGRSVCIQNWSWKKENGFRINA